MDANHFNIPLSRDRQISFHKDTIIFLAIVTLGILLRLGLLGRWSLWTDELYTWRMVNTTSALQHGFPQDQNPPLYDLLMRSWVGLLDCQSEVCLRLPSAIAGIALIPFMWLFGLAIGGKRLAGFSALFSAASPLLIWYSRDARIYSLALFAVVCSIYFYLQVFRDGHWGYALGLTLTTLMGLYTAYSVLAIWFLEVGFVLLLWHYYGRNRRRLLHWSIAQILILLGMIPWIPFLRQQLTRPWQFRWPLSLQSLFNLSISGSLEQVMYVGLIFGIVWILLMLAGSAIFIAKSSIQEWVSHRKIPVAVVGILMLMVVIVLGSIPRGLTLRRQLLVFMPFVILLGSWGMWILRNQILSWTLIILAIGFSLYTTLSPPYQDWRNVTSYINENIEPGEQVLLAPGWSIFAFDYYVDGPMSYEGITVTELVENRSDHVPSGEPVWLVVEQHPSLKEYTEEVERWFGDHAEVMERETFSRYLVVYKYRVQP